jgi:hypothetical protein
MLSITLSFTYQRCMGEDCKAKWVQLSQRDKIIENCEGCIEALVINTAELTAMVRYGTGTQQKTVS